VLTIYLDHNATTPIDPAVVAAMAQAYARVGANPASQHAAGRRARRELDDAAEGILVRLGARLDSAQSDRIVFTSGGTEANNLALLGMCQGQPGRLLVSSIEHPSTLGAAAELQRRGWEVVSIRALESGVIDLGHLGEVLEAPGPPPSLVSVMLGNHETGVLQPVEEVVRVCAPRGIAVHTDAVQVAGKLPVNFSQLGATLMTLTAHKLHGPVGVGALLVRGNTPLRPIFFGGTQQLGQRPGTESVPLVVGMRTALEIWHAQAAERRRHLSECCGQLASRLTALGDVVVNGTAARLPHTLCLSFLGVDRQALLMALDLAGVYASTGSACTSGASEPSHVLRAMGLSRARCESALRFSVGGTTTWDEIGLAAERIERAVARLRGRNSGGNSPGPDSCEPGQIAII
jgi:cysteine desulfurase